MRWFRRFSPAIYEFGLLLRRRVWQPLHRMMEIFHVLPLAAAALIFMLLATNGQLREIYLSYLENLKTANFPTVAVWFITAIIGFGLLSATLYEAHYWLSTARMNVIYSSDSNPDAISGLRSLQRMAAITLALVPWFGLVTGLVKARIYLDSIAEPIRKRHAAFMDDKVNMQLSDLAAMQDLLTASNWSIVLSAILLGVAAAIFLDRHRKQWIVQTVVVGLTPLAAFSLFYLFIGWPLPGLNSERLLCAGIVIAIISAGYYAVHYRLIKMRTVVIFTRSFYRDTGINRRRRQRIALFVWALMPWLLISLYFAISAILTSPTAPSCPETLTAEKMLPDNRGWQMVPLAMSWAITMGIFVTIALDLISQSRKLQHVMVAAIVALMLATLYKSRFQIDDIVSLYRWIGPLGTLALGLLFMFLVFILLAVLSHKSGFPALTLVALAIVICVIFPVRPEWTAYTLIFVCIVFAIMALMSQMLAVAFVALILALAAIITMNDNKTVTATQALDNEAQNKAAEPALVRHFQSWLNQKIDAEPKEVLAAYKAKDKPYPVFIVAVEGGGIYAAAAASLFLAKLQDRHPDFSKHVFAISAVSGGAIGATVFYALNRHDDVASAMPTPSGDCVRPLPLKAQTMKIMGDDYFSPVVGAIFPELFGISKNGRAEVLAAGFKRTVGMHHASAARELQKQYIDHWPAKNSPALILNTTWAETGFRVAFAPFPLHGIDESLYSFLDKDMPDLHEDILDEHKSRLMEAAVMSARFPAILPPYTVKMTGQDKTTRKDKVLFWNFVDGGYSDSSGAATALALYRAIDPVTKKYTAKTGINVEVKVILVTSSNVALDLRKDKVDITGTVFRDTIAPIHAVMKVREGLANQAVARACYDIYGKDQNYSAPGNNSRNCLCASRDLDAKLKIVEIEDKAYGLPLGWKLSSTTLGVVSWMLGDSELCKGEKSHKKFDPACKDQNEAEDDASRGQIDSQLSKAAMLRNSCVLRDIGKMMLKE